MRQEEGRMMRQSRRQARRGEEDKDARKRKDGKSYVRKSERDEKETGSGREGGGEGRSKVTKEMRVGEMVMEGDFWKTRDV